MLRPAERIMNASISNLIDSMRDSSSTTTSQALANIADVVHRAYTSAASDTTADGSKRSEFNRWLIVAAAVVAGFFLLRGMRKMMGFAFGLFWIWYWTSGQAPHFPHFW
jgi:hypothetical protein